MKVSREGRGGEEEEEGKEEVGLVGVEGGVSMEWEGW